MPLRPQLHALRTTGEVLAALTGLCLVNLQQQRQSGGLPALYATDIRYVRERRGQENWQTARDLLRTLSGDCEDLCGYRVSELWYRGERGARPWVIDVRPRLRHAVVRRANGRIEDPSKRLGMRGAG